MWFKNITNWIWWSYTKSLLCCEKSLEVDHGHLFRNAPLIPELSLGIYSWRDHLFYWPDLRLSMLYLIQRYMFYPNLPIIIQAAWNFPGPSPECGSNVRKKKYFVSFLFSFVMCTSFGTRTENSFFISLFGDFKNQDYALSPCSFVSWNSEAPLEENWVAC